MVCIKSSSWYCKISLLPLASDYILYFMIFSNGGIRAKLVNLMTTYDYTSVCNQLLYKIERNHGKNGFCAWFIDFLN